MTLALRNEGSFALRPHSVPTPSPHSGNYDFESLSRAAPYLAPFFFATFFLFVFFILLNMVR